LGHELELDPLAADFEVLESLALGHVICAFWRQKKAQPVGRACFIFTLYI
jgi:hypothetical protein